MFLDVRVVNKSGKLETDVFVKPTDSHQYLHHSSCHPRGCKMSIPYAQALSLRRICSKSEFFEKRVRDLSDFLTARGYNRRFVENQIGRVRRLTRVEAFMGKGHLRNGRTKFLHLHLQSCIKSAETK